MPTTTTLQFLGGAGTVTGSKYLLSSNQRHILVDCGLFQGLKSLRLRNWDGFPIEASQVDAIVLTHAHIDHSGYIPRLIKKGFRGKIYATEATVDLCRILLPDSGHLMEEEAEYLNRAKRTKHAPALPLFTFKEAQDALNQFVAVPFGEKFAVSDSVTCEFRYAGHILGAASAILQVGGRTIGFTGDVGRPNDRLLYPPEAMPSVDYLVTESTYGNRLHSKVDVLDELAQTINETYKRKGVVLVPSFAVGRAQSLLHDLWILRQEKRIPVFPMYLNSPMATNVNKLLFKHKPLHRLDDQTCDEVCSIVKYIHSVEESIELNEKSGPMLIISASGMLTGGRVLHHLKVFAPDAKNTILLTGYQAAGTRGEALLRGADEVKVHGEYVPVRAQVRNLDNISAHADFREMINWLAQDRLLKPRKVFVTHGEPSAADEFRRRLSEKFGWDCLVPEADEKVILE